MSEVQQLVAQLSLKDSFSGPLGKIRKQLGGFDREMGSISSRAYKAGQQVGTGIKRGAVIAAGAVGLLATQVAAGLQSLIALEQATAQTNAVIKSTGGVAGQTAKSIRDLAEKYESLNATIDDKVIQSTENLLLTFTDIRKDAFEPALKAILDMNTAMGGGEAGLQSTAIQVGKALQDPIKGITALRRVGVNFSADQIKVIKRLVETGKTLDAQKLILAELNKEFGGSFLAQGDTTAGKVAKFQDSIEDLQKSLASALLPTIGKVADRLSKFLADPKVISTIEGLGKSIADLFSDKNLDEGGKVLGSLFDTAKAAAPVVKDAAIATLGAVKAAVSLFTSLPKEVQQLAIGAFAINKITGGLVTNLAGGLIGSVLKQLVSGVVNVQGAVVNVVGGPAGSVAGAGAGVKGKIGSVASAVGKVFLVGAAAGVFAELTDVLGDQTTANKEQAAGLSQQTALFIKSASVEEMKASLAALKDTSSYSLAQQLALNLNIDGVRDTIIAQQAKLEAGIAAAESSAATAQVRAIDRAESIASAKSSESLRAAHAAVAGIRRVESAENRAANIVAARIAEAKRAQVAATRRAELAIANKDLSVTLRNTVNVSTSVSVADQIRARTTFLSYGNIRSGTIAS